MSGKWLAIPFAVLLFLGFACNNREQAAIRQIDDQYNQLWPGNTPGGAVLILRGDRPVFKKGYGLATLDPTMEITPSTFFCIASVSKQFAATATLKLAQEGKLSLDDPVSKFFPHFQAPFFDRITLAHLLSHTSGIPDARPRTDSLFVYHSTDVESYSYMDTLSFLNFEPGTSYEYMNPTFQLLYTVIEKASGLPFEEYMEREIFTPAGMDHTMYFEQGREIPQMAHGYRMDTASGQWEEYDYGETTFFASKADGALYTSIEEFSQWEYALQDYKILNKEMTQKAHTAYIQTDIPETGYGYGWFVTETNGAPKIFHTGDNGGFKIYAGRYPESGVLLLIFSTRDFDRDATVAKTEQIMHTAGWL